MKTFYMEKGEYRHLREECLVMTKTFFPEDDWHLSEDMEQSEVIVQVNDDHFFVRIFDQEHELNRGDKDYRNELKRKLYIQYREYSGRDLPWGILQGIRPTKLVFKLFRKMGASDINSCREDLIKKMREDYYVSRDMAVLAVDVACEEAKLIPMNPCDKTASIYVSIPFCPTRCHYCSFPANPMSKWADRMDQYVDGLLSEMNGVLPDVVKKYDISTVYVGGGTPTTLEALQMDRLLNGLFEHIPRSTIKELTVEAGRPDTVSGDKLEVLKKHQVDRISINPQSMNQCTLDLIGRKHDIQSVRDAIEMSREKSFDRINMDTIVGLPGESTDDIQHTFNELMEIRPSELTVHTLAVKRSSIIHENKDLYQLPDHDETKEMLDLTRTILLENGYKPYYLYRQKNMVGSFENVGYYLERPCIYNMEIMEEVISIFAFGAGAITKVVDQMGKVSRSENVKNAEMYLQRLDDMILRKRRL